MLADDAWTDAEKFAWSRIVDGQTANFDLPCNASSVAPADPSLWNQPCRTVRGVVLEQMLTRTPWRDAMQHQGLRMVGALVSGGLDLTNAHVLSAVTLARSRIDGDLALSRAHLDGLLALDGSTITGVFDATGITSDSDVSLGDARLIGGTDGAIGAVETLKTVILRNARIKGSLYVNGGHFHQMVDLRGAHVDEELQTSGAHFLGPLWAGSVQIGVKLSINATRFDSDVLFPDSTIGGLVDASESIFGGKLNLVNGHVAGDVFFNRLAATGGVDLSSTQVGGHVSLAGSSAKGPVKATNTQIGGDLELDGKVRFDKAFTLAGAHLGGSLLMSHVPLGGPVNFRGLHVVGDALMDGAAFAGNLDILAMRVDGDLVMRGASVAGDLTASNVSINHDLTLADGAHVSGAVNLFDAHVGNSVHMEHASFDKGAFASDAQVAGDMFLDGSIFGAAVVLSGARIGGDLQLSGVRIGKLDLTGATIDGSLEVDAGTTWLPPPSGESRQLSLINAKVGGLQDGAVGTLKTCPSDQHPPPTANGWPTGQTIELDGFTYGHLGASAGTEGADMRERAVCWWRWWLERDPDFSSQPYVQLASVMTAHGDQESAAVVLYYGRSRETRMAWESGHYLRWMLLAALNVVTGYGIGTYSFRAFWWIISLTVVGAVLLTLSPGGRQRTWLWRAGASLARVLPGIEINKEFTDFFDDPQRKRLTDLQVVIFSAFVVIGWVLGLFVVAALTGLTQHS